MAARSYLMPVLLSALGTTVLGAAARPAWGGERDLYDRTVNLIQADYLDAATLDGLAAWRGAAKSAEDAIPWLVTEGEGTQLILRHGATGPIGELSAPAGPAGSTLNLAAALDAMEDAIRAGGALPDDVDLPIELIRGLTRAMDKHSTVLARSRLESFDERISGRLSGVGARMGTVKGRLVVKEAFPGGPADEAGLKAGDVVLRVDGHSTLGQSVNQVVRHIRGPVGTQVLLSILRESGPQPEEFDIVLTREDVVIPNVTWRRRPSGVGVATIDHFSEQTAMLLTQALVEMESGKAPLRGIILDLRGNSGGSMIQACRSVDLFVESGVVLRTEGRDGERVENLLREYRAHPEPNESTAPVVVLVDENSASAAEILAGSLSRLNRAVLIGQRTHGKGTVQKLYTVRGGGPDERARLKLTVARYKLPGDIGIEPGVGLPPDLLVRPITFSAEGVRYDPTDPGAGAVLDWVDERPGWRRGENAPQDTRDSFLVDLAERVLLAAASGSRADLLMATERVTRIVRKEEDDLLVKTFRYRGIDWRAADEGGPAPKLFVQLSTGATAVAGAEVEVRAVIENRGSAPLYRVAARLEAQSPDLPWGGLVLPLGFVPPGELGLATALSVVSPRLPSSNDLVSLSVQSDKRPAVKVPPQPLDIQGRQPTPLAVKARVVPEGPDHHRVEVELRNLGTENLVDVRLRLALPEDASFELLAREAVTAYLRADEVQRLDLPVVLDPLGPPTLDVELRVDAGVQGAVLRLPIKIPINGSTVLRQPPRLLGEAPPTVVSPGRILLRLDATDDRRVSSITTWLDRDKIAWQAGTGKKTRMELPVEIPPGPHSLVVMVEDDEGARTRRVFHVRGVDSVPANAPSPPP